MADEKMTLAPIADYRPGPWTVEQVALIKRTCCPGEQPPDDAFAVYIHTCKASGLDPLLKEACLVKRQAWNPATKQYGVTWQTMATRDGYLAAAHRTGALRGIQTVVFPEDPSQVPTHATCRVWRDGWPEPIVVTVAFREYCQYKDDRPVALWGSKPRTMIGKVAESQALRRAFSLHGTYCAEELPEEPAQVEATVKSTQPLPPKAGQVAVATLSAPAAKPSEGGKTVTYTTSGTAGQQVVIKDNSLGAQPAEVITPKQLTALQGLSRQYWGDNDGAKKEWLAEMFGVKSSKDLTKHQASKAIETLQPLVETGAKARAKEQRASNNALKEIEALHKFLIDQGVAATAAEIVGLIYPDGRSPDLATVGGAEQYLTELKAWMDREEGAEA